MGVEPLVKVEAAAAAGQGQPSLYLSVSLCTISASINPSSFLPLFSRSIFLHEAFSQAFLGMCLGLAAWVGAPG